MVMVFSTALGLFFPPPDDILDLRDAFGVLDPNEEEMEGMDLELRLAERELWRLPDGILELFAEWLWASEVERLILGLCNLSQKCSADESSPTVLEASLLVDNTSMSRSLLRSKEFWGELVLLLYLCFLFNALGDGVDLGDLGLVSWPIEASPATSKAEMAARVEVLALVSTYINALTCWLKLNAWSADTGARPCLAKVVKISRSLRRSAWQPTSMMGVTGATLRTSGHQWLTALKSEEGSEIL